MKDLKDSLKNKLLSEGLKIGAKTKVNTLKYNYHPKTWDELRELIVQLVGERDLKADLNDIDVSAITDMNSMFYRTDFKGDISKWDVSNVKNMCEMFYRSQFNGDISEWDVSNVTDMYYMFKDSEFTGENGDISEWDVSNVTDMRHIFDNSPLQKNPPKWYKE